MQCCRSWILKVSSIKINDNNDNLPSNTCLPLPPTAQVGKIPPERWVWGARCLPLPPTAQGGSTPYRGWAYLHGGQSPFSPQLKTNFAPPCPSLPPLLAVVTAMVFLAKEKREAPAGEKGSPIPSTAKSVERRLQHILENLGEMLIREEKSILKRNSQEMRTILSFGCTPFITTKGGRM